MSFSRISKRTLGTAILGLILISFFQNCGQPGSIVANSGSEKVSDAPVDVALGDEVDTPAVPTPEEEPTLKSYEKVVKINASSNKVDVLVVVDNSGSMSFEQENMANRFNNFLGKLQGLDWQVGITTTDVTTDRKYSEVKGGRLLYFSRMKSYLIKATDDQINAQKAFAQTVQRPSNEGSSKEQGIKATYRALERSLDAKGPNVGLVRDGAALSVILVSDSDETVDNKKPGDVTTFGDKNKGENLLKYIKTQFPNKIVKFNSIIVRDKDKDCLYLKDSGNEAYGKNYQALTNLTSGVLGSVCETDYANQLSIIGDSTTEMTKVVTLECAPVDGDKNGSLDLTVKNSLGVMQNNYTVSGRIVTFAQVLAVDTYTFNYRCLVP
jgi:hypothetical protein